GSTATSILTGLAVDERFARTDLSGRTDFLSDALNSTIALTNSAGAIVEQYSYDPYGTTTDSVSGFDNPYQYTGRENDGDGLYYYRARYYAPAMGRFISEDPLGFASESENFYAYVGDNPLTYTDPFGLCGCKRPKDASRVNNPHLGRNVLVGAGVTAVVGIVALNVIGFPEAEAAEGAGAITYASVYGADGATALAIMDALAGEPMMTRILLSFAGAANGGAVGAITGFLYTSPQSANCP
ncbi:MAG: RHS repeat-associated core domain-containing protein, partial [Alphaproteobacteria bacterium]|nr:RHS repeat-associated core domain-containing protein [Alphaproteobacteria bacterium]